MNAQCGWVQGTVEEPGQAGLCGLQVLLAEWIQRVEHVCEGWSASSLPSGWRQFGAGVTVGLIPCGFSLSPVCYWHKPQTWFISKQTFSSHPLWNVGRAWQTPCSPPDVLNVDPTFTLELLFSGVLFSLFSEFCIWWSCCSISAQSYWEQVNSLWWVDWIHLKIWIWNISSFTHQKFQNASESLLIIFRFMWK